jgi:cytochrome b pre-mRNA-processing protein 3
MQAFGEAFYGRAAAYDVAFGAGGDAPAKALCKNILNGEGMENARRLATYAQTVMARLDGLDAAAFEAAGWAFPAPAEG